MSETPTQTRTKTSQAALLLLRDLIEERTGIHYADRQIDILGDRLHVRMAELGMLSFLDYYYLLKYDDEARAEWPLLHCCITINETYFWRESEALQLAVNDLVPECRRAGRQKIRIWHAGCSTGEEPYSLAMGLDASGEFARTSIEINATDLDLQALEAARKGIYRERSLRYLPEAFKLNYFQPTEDGRFALSQDIKDRIHFVRENLLDPKSPKPAQDLDIIFCRNVLIYFRDPVIARVLQTFHAALRQGGYLMMGASESLLRFQSGFQLVQKGHFLTYCKMSENGADGL